MNKYKFYKNDEEFHKIRSKTIGASDIPIILGLSNFSTPYKLWREKTGREKPFEGNEKTSWGHRHEMNILSSYIEQSHNIDTAYTFELDYLANKRCRALNYKPPTIFFPFTEFHHPEIKWAIAHPDCIDMENRINIEAKSGSHYANIKREGMDGFDPDDPSGYPLKYYVQIQWQMFCSGLESTVLRALIDTNREMSYNITANKKIQERLAELASRFMYCIKKDKEPMPINSDDIKKIFPIVNAKTDYLIGAKSELALKMKDRKKFLADKVKKYKSEIEDINNAMMIFAGDNKYIYSEDNEKICTQVRFMTERIKWPEDIKKEDINLYLNLKEKGLIYDSETRYIR